MTLVDSHVHVWDPRRLAYAWLSETGLDRAMLPPEVDRVATVPTEMVFVQASDGDPLAEARWVDQLTWPELIAIVAGADLTREPQDVEAHLAALAEIPRVVGVRHLLQDTAVADFAAVSEGLRILESHGGTFDACIRHTQLPALTDLLDPVPGLTVVLDHLGKPPVDAGIDSPDGRRWSEQIGILAARPRTYVKLSGLAPESSGAAAFAQNADAFIGRALEAFGAQRAMIGSDWPVSSHFGVGVTMMEWAVRVERLVGTTDWPAVSGTTARSAYLPGGASPLRIH
ncbi:amidohydrolase family protein [Microbacterium sp. DT81.1]|uniref:amidohydrolase family protein n=1 Tax=Microbacterium sp. DT81.1 TaxID=3393413 RepID=UPI003CF38A3F